MSRNNNQENSVERDQNAIELNQMSAAANADESDAVNNSAINSNESFRSKLMSVLEEIEFDGDLTTLLAMEGVFIALIIVEYIKDVGMESVRIIATALVAISIFYSLYILLIPWGLRRDSEAFAQHYRSWQIMATFTLALVFGVFLSEKSE